MNTTEIYSILIKNIYNIWLIIQPALLSKKRKCFYKLNVINNVSLKFKLSDTLRHKLKVNYQGVTESIFPLR